MLRGIRAAIYRTELEATQITRDGKSVEFDPIAASEIRLSLQAEAESRGGRAATERA